MFKSRILFRILFLLAVFSLTFIIPVIMNVSVSIDTVFEKYAAEKDINITGLTELKGLIIEKLYSDVTVIIFYVFIIAFIIAVFFSRKIVLPVKMLLNGAESISKGKFDIVLPVLSEDEMGEVTRAFNRMASSVVEQTAELRKKDIYIESMMDPMWVLDVNDNIVEINPAFTRVYGYEESEIKGLPAHEFVKEDHVSSKSRVPAVLGRMEHDPIGRTFLIAKDGRDIPVILTQNTIKHEDVNIGKIGFIRDITEINGLLTRLTESTKQMEEIMNSIDEEILLIDSDYRIIDANMSAHKLYGDNIVGKECYKVGHGNNKPCWVSGEECPVQKVYLYGSSWQTVHEHIDVKGVKHYEEIKASPIKDINGNIRYVVELIRDITESKKYEEMISRKNKELSTLNRIAAILNGSLNAEEIFSGVIDALIKTFEMDGGGIYILDHESKMLKCSYHKGVTEDFARTIGNVRLGDDIPGRVALTGEHIMITDLTKDYRIDRSLLRTSGIKGYCCFPVNGKEKLIGVLCLFGLREHYFGEEERRIITSVGEMCGLALENISLYERIKSLFGEQKRRHLQEQNMLFNLGSGISSSSEITNTIISTLEVLKDHFHAEASWYASVRKNGSIMIEHVKGMEIRDKDTILGADLRTMEHELVRTGEYLVLEDLFVNKKYDIPDILSRQGFRTVVCVPVKRQEKTIGIISLFYKNVTRMQEEDLHFMMTVAILLEIIIELYDLYEKRVVEKGLADTVLNSINEGICTVNEEGIIQSTNSSVPEILGIDDNELGGRNIFEIIPFGNGNEPVKTGSSVISRAFSGEKAVCETEYVRGDGNEMVLQIETSPLHDAKGGINGAVIVMRDISREKVIERMKTELVRSVSHEFRTPLSALVGMTEMLIEGDVSGERADDYLRTMHSEGERLSRMVSDLLDLSRIEMKRSELDRKEVDVRRLLEDAVGGLQPLIEGKAAVIDYSLDERVKTIFVDEKHFRQVIKNLLSNALTYSDKGVRITMNVKKEDNSIIIEIIDTGWGIKETVLPRIGERFYRGEYSGMTKGTGLGLALCRQIVQLHGGEIGLESTLNEGTHVKIMIPIEE